MVERTMISGGTRPMGGSCVVPLLLEFVVVMVDGLLLLLQRESEHG